MNLTERRQAEFEKYRKVYRDYPNYCNREVRVELTREWVESYPKAKALLDVGCGRGEVLKMVEGLGLMPHGCDVVVPEVLDSHRIDLIEGAHELPYMAQSFDLVTCTDVMEHLLEEDVPAVLKELAAVARGPVLLAICHIPDKPGKYGPDTLHITVHPREWWEQKIRKHMSTTFKALYLDRVNGNGTWFEVQCA